VSTGIQAPCCVDTCTPGRTLWTEPDHRHPASEARVASLGHLSKFQRFSRVGFVTAPTSLNGGQPKFARCLVVSWAGILYTCISGARRGSCPLTEFCQVQNSLYVQVLRSLILEALLHGTPAAGVSQTLRPCARNGITEHSQRAPPIFGWAAITLGIGPHSSSFMDLFLCNHLRCIFLCVLLLFLFL